MNCIVRKEGNQYTLYSFSTTKFYPLSNSNFIETFFSSKGVSDGLNSLNLSDKELSEVISKTPKTFNPLLFGSPLVVGLMVSNHCNIHCKYCIAYNSGGYSKTNILNENIEYLIEDFKSAGIIGILISGGEPTLNPELNNILTLFAEKDFYITLDSNAVVLDDKTIDILAMYRNIIPRISLDSNTAKIHNKYRGFFDQTFSNITKLIERGVDVRINTVLHNENAAMLNEMAEWLITIGIKKWHIFKLQPQFAPSNLHISDDLAESTISALKVHYAKYISINCKFSKENDGFASFVVDSELNCFSTDNRTKVKVIFGNLMEKGISEIWKETTMDFKIRHISKYLGIKEVAL